MKVRRKLTLQLWVFSSPPITLACLYWTILGRVCYHKFHLFYKNTSQVVPVSLQDLLLHLPFIRL